MKRFVTILIAIMALAIPLVACGESGNTGTLASGNTPTRNGSTPTAAPSSKHFKVGDSVDVGGKWKVAVNSATTSTGGEYTKPKGVYLVIRITANNISSQEQSMSSMDFSLKGTDGVNYNQTIVSDIDGVLDSPGGKVEAGGVTKGDIIFDVPVDVKQFRLAFAPSWFSSGQTIWDISL
jgi:hypothetical protein